MAPKRMLAAVIGSFLVVAPGGPASASDYRAGELFNLDLSKAVLSPKLLGPPAEFIAVPVQARAEARQVVEPSEASPRTVRTISVPPRVRTAKTSVAPKVRTSKRDVPARAKLARRGSPLDAHAMDTRIQVWPCKSGGICTWKR